MPRALDPDSNYIFDLILRQLSVALWERGHLLMPFPAISEIEGDLDSYERVLAQASPDAVLISDVEATEDPRLLMLDGQGVPFVAIGHVEEPVCSWVDVDLASGIEQAVTHLVGRGHQRIAFLGFPLGENVADQEYEGYRRGLALNGVEKELHEQLTYRARKSDLNDALQSLVGYASPEPVALIAACDEWAIEALDRAVSDQPPRLPELIAVVGVDDTPAATARRPHLTSLRQPIAALCRDAVMLIEERVDHPGYERRYILEKPSLQVGASTTDRLQA